MSDAPADLYRVVIQNADGSLRPLEEIERDIFKLAIVHCRGNMTKTAKALGIGRNTLYCRTADLRSVGRYHEVAAR